MTIISIRNRKKLGERMLSWHSSMNDPIYAVGSFYLCGKKYPKVEIVENAIRNLSSDLDLTKNDPLGDEAENIVDLEWIISTLKSFLKEDYSFLESGPKT